MSRTREGTGSIPVVPDVRRGRGQAGAAEVAIWVDPAEHERRRALGVADSSRPESTPSTRSCASRWVRGSRAVSCRRSSSICCSMHPAWSSGTASAWCGTGCRRSTPWSPRSSTSHGARLYGPLAGLLSTAPDVSDCRKPPPTTPSCSSRPVTGALASVCKSPTGELSRCFLKLHSSPSDIPAPPGCSPSSCTPAT